MSNKYEITGKVIAISETQTFASGFQKREFVVETNEEKYPQKIKLEAAKDGCAKLDSYNIGDTVTVGFNIRGNEYNGKYYVNLQAWKFERTGEPKVEKQSDPSTPPPSYTSDSLDQSDDVPF